MGQPEEGRMGNPSQLIEEGCIQFGMSVAMQIGPNGGIPVQISLSVAGDEPGPLSGLDRNGVKLGIHPRGGRSKGVPKVRPIQPDDLVVFQIRERESVRSGFARGGGSLPVSGGRKG